MLDWGYDGQVEIRREKLAHLPAGGVSVMYLSDFHFNGYSDRMSERLIQLVQQAQPQVLLLGGDYLDTRAGMAPFQRFLQSLENHPHVLAVAGNHDHFFGLNAIQEMMAAHGVFWLEQTSRQLHLNSRTLQIDGNCTSQNTADCRILCLHQPRTLPPDAGYDLVLAGHLHGSQVVLWQTARGLYPGRWFYRWNMLDEPHGRGRYLVSRGLGDTLPIRFNCPREAVLVTT